MAGLYYEEFSVDQEFVHAWSRTVTEMVSVCRRTAMTRRRAAA